VVVHSVGRRIVGVVFVPVIIVVIIEVLRGGGFEKRLRGPAQNAGVNRLHEGEVDVGAVAKEFGGGGHKNAAGCSASGPVDDLRKVFVEKVSRAIDGRPARH